MIFDGIDIVGLPEPFPLLNNLPVYLDCERSRGNIYRGTANLLEADVNVYTFSKDTFNMAHLITSKTGSLCVNIGLTIEVRSLEVIVYSVDRIPRGVIIWQCKFCPIGLEKWVGCLGLTCKKCQPLPVL